MIKDTSFVGCENLPDEMANALDRPWEYIGQFCEKRHGRCVTVLCTKCHNRNRNELQNYNPNTMRSIPPAMDIVDLRGRRFTTDDMIELVVYFGICRECGLAHWATSAPPFRRARAMVAELS